MLENSRIANIMGQEAEVAKEIWLVVQKLKKYSLLTPSNEYIKYGISEINSINQEEHRKILHKLEADGAIKIKSEAHTDNSFLSGLNHLGYPSFHYRIDLVEEQFNKKYRYYAELNGHTSTTIITKAPYFDVSKKEKTLIFNDKKCKISGVNRRVLCKVLFLDTPLGEWVDEDDIVSEFRKENKRSFYDAIRLFNEAVENELGIEKILDYEGSQVRVRTESFRSE